MYFKASAYCIPVPVPKLGFCSFGTGTGIIESAAPYHVCKLNPKMSINQSNVCDIGFSLREFI